MTKLILIDGDILAYSIGFSVEVPVYVAGGKIYTCRTKAEKTAKKFGREVVKRKNIGSFQGLRMKLRNKMKEIFENLGSKSYRMFLTESGIENNFRHKIGTLLPYKGNRENAEKPFFYDKVREVLQDEYKAELVTGQEADDAIGIAQYEASKKHNSFENTYIASIDKDLRMLQGWHYNLNTKMIDYIGGESALKNFYGQLLKGDTTDNIPGITKILKLKDRTEEAKKLSYGRPGFLKQYEQFRVDHSAQECYDYVIGLYESYELDESIITEVGQLLWMRREENEFWQPKKKMKPI